MNTLEKKIYRDVSVWEVFPLSSIFPCIKRKYEIYKIFQISNYSFVRKNVKNNENFCEHLTTLASIHPPSRTNSYSHHYLIVKRSCLFPIPANWTNKRTERTEFWKSRYKKIEKNFEEKLENSGKQMWRQRNRDGWNNNKNNSRWDINFIQIG